MRIIHISDLHASADQDFGQRRIIAAFLKDLRAQHQSTPVDLVVFTGDLADRGSSDELLMGHELLIEPTLNEVGLDTQRLVVVPGNHDVDRALINKYEDAGLHSQLTTEEEITSLLVEPGAFERLTARLESWLSYSEMVSPDKPALLGTLATATKFAIDSRTVGVVTLNSAWRSSSREDERRLLVGSYQVTEALARVEGADLVLVAAHHPLDWLARFDENAVRQALEGRSALYLCGHLHDPSPSDELRRGQVIYSRAGCLYESEKYLNSYSLIDLNDDAVKIRMRTWWPDRGCFDVAINVAADGMFEARWRGVAIGKALPASTTVLAGLGQVVEESSFLEVFREATADPTVDDLLVEPRLLPIPFKDALAAKKVEDEFEIEEISPWSSDWLSASVVIVAGEPEAGVSSALVWLLARRYLAYADMLPVYVPFDERFSARGLERAVAQAARLAGWSGTTKGIPPLVIGLDDVTPTGRGLEVVTAFLSSHSEHRCIIGCRQEDQPAISRALAAAGLRTINVFLGPFGRRQLRALVKKAAGVGTGQIIDAIFDVVDAQDLPRTPFILTALVAVVRTMTAGDLANLTESELLQAYVGLLLGRDEIQGADRLGMDFRRRDYLLGSLAKTLTESELENMTRLEAEEYMAGWFSAKGWGPESSPGRVLDDLIGRRVLAESPAGEVGFRQPALLQLFTAKWMLESAEFREELLQNPLEHSVAISHAASLQRSSQQLLVAVLAHVKAIVDERASELSLFDEVIGEDGWSGFKPKASQLTRVLEEEPDEAPRERSESERDAELDAFYEERVAHADDEGVAVFAEHEERVGEATMFLMDVLRSSELVDDVLLKKEALETALRGLALLASYASRGGEASALREYLERDVSDGDSQADIGTRECVIRLFLIATLLMSMERDLATPQLAMVIEQVMREADATMSSALATFVTLLYGEARGGAAVKEMRQLFEAHREHPIIVNLLRAWTHWTYERENSQGLRQKLEALLIDIYLHDDRNTGRGQLQRRESVARNIRTLRLRRLARRRRHSAGLDALDEAGPEEPDRAVATEETVSSG